MAKQQKWKLKSVVLTAVILAMLAASILPFVVFASQKSATTSNSTINVPWWSGDCDDGNYSKHVHDSNGNPVHPYILRDSATGQLAIWKGIESCGPKPLDVPKNQPDNFVYFTATSSQEQEFECTELVKRYLKLTYGLDAISANGDQVVGAYTARSSITGVQNPFFNHRIVNDGKIHMFPIAGDVISSTSNGGH